MHFTGTVYRNPYWPTYPLLQITQGCTHNRCEFCSMYKGIPFHLQPIKDVEADLKEIASVSPHARTIQILSANPLALSFTQLKRYFSLIHKYLPDMEYIYAWTRVTDILPKTVEQLKELRDMGLREISLGIESGDDWTLDRVHKGYHAADILKAGKMLDEAGIRYWVSFLNGVAGRSHSKEHAIHTAEIFNQLHPMVVGVTALVLFPGTELERQAQEGKFDPLNEKELLEEELLFYEHLDVNCINISHHTSSLNLTTDNFKRDKDRMIADLKYEIAHGNFKAMAEMRSNTRTL